MKKSKRNLLIILLVIFVVALVGFLIVFNIISSRQKEIKKNLEETNSSSLLLKQASLLSEKSKSHTANASSYDKDGDIYYNTAQIMYENRNFESCIDNCLKARDYYSNSGQEYRNAKALWEKIEELNITELQKVITYYIGLNDVGSNVEYAIFEACEGLESMCRLASLGDYTTAQNYLEQTNEKIKSHDYWVEIYNEYVAKIKTLG